MSAIAGLWHFDGRPAADECGRMLDAQRHYGPDARGQWSDGSVSIGSQLMHFLPEDPCDRQPVIGGQGRFVLVADLRLDNRDDLSRALRIPASVAGRSSDAAILMSAIERWDTDCCSHLLGDYAFACWDVRDRRLLLARDPFGERPLHYHRHPRFVAFSSMPKGLHTLPDVPYESDDEMVADFLLVRPKTGSRTFFRGLDRVEPGHLVVVSVGGLTTHRHWEFRPTTIRLRSTGDYHEAMRHHLDEAVRCRLRGAGTIGAQLSGGLDSSAVASTAARLLSTSTRRVVAYTATPREGYDGPVPADRVGDESHYAAATAAMYPNMDHVLVRPTGSPLDHLDKNLALYDRPLLNLCNDLWDRAIKDAAQGSGIRVLLTGQSGNSTISYAGTEALAEAFVTGQWLRWARAVAAMCRTGAATPQQAVFRTLAPLVPEKLWSWLRPAGRGRSDPATYSAIHPDRLADLKRLERARRVDARHWPNPLADGIAIRLRALGRDSGNYQAGNRAGWGIDVRDPTRDVRLVEFCLALPLTEYLNAGHNRAMVRLGLADRLPHTVRMGARRGLQAADWHERLAAGRDDITRELQRLSACPAAVRALDLSRLSQLVAAWPSGGWHRPLVTMTYRYALLRAISTGYFLRRVADGRH